MLLLNKTPDTVALLTPCSYSNAEYLLIKVAVPEFIPLWRVSSSKDMYAALCLYCFITSLVASISILDAVNYF